MIRNLEINLGIPADILIQEYSLADEPGDEKTAEYATL